MTHIKSVHARRLIFLKQCEFFLLKRKGLIILMLNPIPTGEGGQSDPQHYIFAYKTQSAYT